MNPNINIPNNAPSSKELERMRLKAETKAFLMKLLTKPEAFLSELLSKESEKSGSAEKIVKDVLFEIKILNQFESAKSKLLSYTFEDLKTLGLEDKLPEIIELNYARIWSVNQVEARAKRDEVKIEPPKNHAPSQPAPSIGNTNLNHISVPPVTTPQSTVPANSVIPSLTSVNPQGVINTASSVVLTPTIPPITTPPFHP